MAHDHSQHLKSLKNKTSKRVNQTQLSEENELINAEAPQSDSAQALPNAASAVINRAFYNDKLAGAQRQAAVRQMAAQGGNQHVQRMLNHNCSSKCGHLTAKPAANVIRRAPAAEAASEEKAPLQLSGVIKPTRVDGEPEPFCDSTAGTAKLPTLQRWIPQLPNIIKSTKNQRRNRPIEVQFNLGMNQRTEQGTKEPGQAHAGHSHGLVMGHDEATINSNIGVKTQTKNSGNVAATGEEIFGYAAGKVFVDGDWTLSGNILKVNATMHVIAYWAISSQGRERISGADDEKINSSTWSNVIYDLQTDAEGVPLRRKLYYVPSITAAHELFHVSDMFKQANTYAHAAKAWLDTQTVHIPDTIFGLGEDEKNLVQFNLNTTLTELSFKAEDNIKQYIMNGGESRAYRFGKSAYDSLRAEIKQRAVDNGWDLPKSPELRESLELQPGQKKL